MRKKVIEQTAIVGNDGRRLVLASLELKDVYKNSQGGRVSITSTNSNPSSFGKNQQRDYVPQ